MKVINAVAQVLSISENQIASIQEWAKVYFVKFNVGRPTFVSKRAVLKLLPLTLELSTPRKSYRAWVAKINGLDSSYGFKREFLEPVERQFGKKGEVSAKFIINSVGIYHDSDGDYTIVERGEDGLSMRVISYQEVKYILEKSANKIGGLIGL